MRTRQRFCPFVVKPGATPPFTAVAIVFHVSILLNSLPTHANVGATTCSRTGALHALAKLPTVTLIETSTGPTLRLFGTTNTGATPMPAFSNAHLAVAN